MKHFNRVFRDVVTITIVLLLLLSQAIRAQNYSSNPLVQELTLLTHDEAKKDPAQGSSPNGRYIFGYGFSSSFIYDTETGEYTLPAENILVQYVLNNGDAVVFKSKGSGGILQKGSTTVIPFTSPNNNFPYVGPCYSTTTGKYIIGNLSNGGHEVRPFIAFLEGKEYVLHELQAPKLDLLGSEAQYTKAICCSEDGSVVYGSQIDYLGIFHRPICWKKQPNGNYQFEGMFDDLFFNLSTPIPGKYPNEKDYVTAAQDTPEYKAQVAEYNKAVNEWNKKVLARTKEDSFVTKNWQLSSNKKFLCGSIKHANINDDFTTEYPLLYDIENNKTIVLRDMATFRAIENINGNDIICLSGFPAMGAYSVYSMLKKDSEDFVAWLSKISGNTSLKEMFSYTVDDGMESKTICNTGFPTISANGKIIVFYAMPNLPDNNARNGFIKFSKSLHNTFLGSNSIVKQKDSILSFDTNNGQIMASPSSFIVVYSFAGERVWEGKTNSNGSCYLPKGLHSRSNYIVLDSSTQQTCNIIW